MRRLTFSMTGSPLRIERPRSPRSRRPIHAAYCTGIGWSRPSSRAQRLLHGGVDRLRHHGVDRIARRQVQQREDAGGDEQQDGDGRAQPAQDEPAHQGPGAISRDHRSHTSLNRIIPSGIGS